MFEKTQEELKAMGADITTAEIKQQPELWLDAVEIFKQNKDAIQTFLQQALDMADDKDVTVAFAGAGTSQYVGDVLVPYLNKAAHDLRFHFVSTPTTDVVSDPYGQLDPEAPTILVSFARSGNSPESLATVHVAKQIVTNLMCLNITCAPEGKLAQESQSDEHALTILIPRANDAGFAMTGSFSCMLLMAALIFDQAPEDEKFSWVKTAAAMGEEVVKRESEIAAWLTADFNRITYLGSGAMAPLTREAQLKVLELAAGKVATNFDSSMGYRHGPKSFVDEHTIVFDFVSNNAYTRQYDLDILHEIAGDKIAAHTVAIQQATGELYEGESFTFDATYPALPEVYCALPFIMVAQTVSLLNSVRVGNTPDTPSPTGTVNRVVKGVTIHPLA